MAVTIDPASKKWVIDGVVQDLSSGAKWSNTNNDQTTGHWFINSVDTGMKPSVRTAKTVRVLTNLRWITAIHLTLIPG